MGKSMYTAADIANIFGISENTARAYLNKVAKDKRPFPVLNHKPISVPAKQFDKFFGQETSHDKCFVYDTEYVAMHLGRTLTSTVKLMNKMAAESEPSFPVIRVNNLFRIPKKGFSEFMMEEIDWDYVPSKMDK